MNMTSIGKYRLEEPIGSGYQGQVMRAIDASLDRTVALKLLRQDKISNFDKKSLRKEAKILARLSHPNIVTLYELVEHDGRPVMVMQYVDGMTLTEKLSSGPLSIESALPIFRQLAEAMREAHSMDLVHGDIKPGNIMICHTGEPMLVDFGLAKLSNHGDILETVAGAGQQFNALEGTLPYMSPEKIMGKPADKSADIFSLGAVFYEILTAKRAFDAASPDAVVNQILSDLPKPLVTHGIDAPNWAQTLVDNMLEKQPDKRIASMTAVANAIRMQGKSGGGFREDLWFNHMQRVWKHLPMGIGWRQAVAVTILLLLGAGGFSLYRDLEPSISSQMNEGLDLVRNFAGEDAVAESQAAFAQIIKKDPDHAAANAGMALSLIRQYTSEESDPSILRRATALAEASLDSDPQLALANIAAAWAAEFNGDFPRALSLSQTANALDPDNILILEGMGRTYLKQGEYDKAETLLKRALKLYPDYRIYYSDLGRVLSKKGKFAAAEDVFRRSLKRFPDNILDYANLSHVLHMQGQTRDAIRSIQDGLKVSPHPMLYNNLGTYLFFEGRYEESAKAFERTLEFDGNAHEFVYWANLGDAYRFTTVNKAKAVAAHRRAIQLLLPRLEKRPDDEGLNSRLALYAAKMGDRPLAIRALNKATRTPVKESTTFYRAAITQEILGNRSLALLQLQRALDRGYAMNEIANEPELAKLREDARYHNIVSIKGE